MGIVNVGGPGTVSAAGDLHTMEKGDVLYLGRGLGPVTFGGQGRFYLTSAPAHASLPARLIRLADAKSFTTGAAETANHRTIYQFIHPEVMESCQLVLGYTKFHGGSVWNTMPAHLHDRRMEAYFYFDLAPDARAIHCGAGTGSYTFVWAMAGDNVDYKDVGMIAMEDLR
jgi:4-deoxy-L-threo-5-hexosulose-uronate ketol-isomerase